jgi:hypothetical protein
LAMPFALATNQFPIRGTGWNFWNRPPLNHPDMT